ncbi:MAG: hypothetical protein ISN64_03850 [Rickettsia sp.]|nr:hypothetical protein [Rickettsia sp.]
MQKNFSKSKIFFLIITFAFTAIFTKLGFWQLDRFKLKNNIKNNIKSSLLKESYDISDLSDEKIKNIPLYSKILVKAQIKEIFPLYGARYGFRAKKDGNYICNIINDTKNRKFLINRGWIDKNTSLDHYINSQKFQYFEALTMPFEAKSSIIPSNNSKIWFTLSKDDAKSFWNIDIDNYYLLSIDNFDSNSPIKPLSIENLVFLKDNHLGYSITWFLFSIITLIIFFYMNSKSNE